MKATRRLVAQGDANPLFQGVTGAIAPYGFQDSRDARFNRTYCTGSGLSHTGTIGQSVYPKYNDVSPGVLVRAANWAAAFARL